MTKVNRASLPTILAIGLMCLPIAANAEEKLPAEKIANAVSDHTYQGSMSSAGSGFAEYYAADGTIRAKGYSGKWRTEDGKMCFKYGDKPERCFGIQINGPSIVMLKDGKIDGNGMLIRGNPNKF